MINTPRPRMACLGSGVSDNFGIRLEPQGATERSKSGSVSSSSSTIMAELIQDRRRQPVSQLGELEQAQLALKDMQSVMAVTDMVRHELLNEE